jgi:hypothetical protein
MAFQREALVFLAFLAVEWEAPSARTPPIDRLHAIALV